MLLAEVTVIAAAALVTVAAEALAVSVTVPAATPVIGMDAVVVPAEMRVVA